MWVLLAAAAAIIIAVVKVKTPGSYIPNGTDMYRQPSQVSYFATAGKDWPVTRASALTNFEGQWFVVEIPGFPNAFYVKTLK